MLCSRETTIQRRPNWRTLCVLLSIALLSSACSYLQELDHAASPTSEPAPALASDLRGHPGLTSEPEAPEANVVTPTNGALDGQPMMLDRLLSQAQRPFATEIGFDPQTSQHYELIQGAFPLSPAEQGILDELGFVFTGNEYITFAQAYDSIFQADLPVYISADAMQFAVHRSYDSILSRIESQYMAPQLNQVLRDMRQRIRDGALSDFSEERIGDVDVYLTVAVSLLEGHRVVPAANGDVELITELYEYADSATSGMVEIDLMGSLRSMDTSQFEPRGHYADSELLSRYFKSMMWLGRIDLRMIETLPYGAQVFNRRQFEVAAAMATLMDESIMNQYAEMASVIDVFVGSSDNMTPPEFDSLRGDLGAANIAAIAQMSDAEIENALRDGGYGAQEISSHIMWTLPGEETMPLSSTFLLFGQAYCVDSHAFSELVFDRLPGRMMPNPLDVAYTVFANDTAVALLADDLRTHGHADQMQQVRDSVAARGQSFWEQSLYNLWLNSLRALSPGDEITNPVDAGLPRVFTTEAWSRRILNTQLASWSELRHDTLLYAKQSYTSAISCEFPDAYVDPYPEYFRALANYANAGHARVASIGLPGLDDYFVRLGEIANTLADMAQRQRDGLPLSAAHLAFANDMVRTGDMIGCGGPPEMNGWYADLFVMGADPMEFDPTIADVHTQPTNLAGLVVGRVLHVATGRPRMMVVTVDTPQGPRAFAGAVSSYHEVITSDFVRINDMEWAHDHGGRADHVSWVRDLMAESGQ